MSTATTYDPFESDWRACLEAHLRFVISTGDTINETSLLDVLKAAGMTDDDIARVRYEVTGQALVSDINKPVTSETMVDPAQVTAQPVIDESPAESLVEDLPIAEHVALPADVMPVDAISEPQPSAELEEVPLAQAATEDAEAPPPMQLSLF